MQSGAVEKAVEPSEPPPASAKTAKRRRFSQRPPSIRVDDVGATAASMSADLGIPRPTLAARRPTGKLETREAWVLSLVDGTMTIEDIADVTGIVRADVKTIVTHLADLGYVAGRFR
jgi:hypothetical protein